MWTTRSFSIFSNGINTEIEDDGANLRHLFASVFLREELLNIFGCCLHINKGELVTLLSPKSSTITAFVVMKPTRTEEHHVFIVNAGEQEAYILEAAAYSVGRDKSNAIRLDFATISRQHALLLRVPDSQSEGYKYRIVDGNAEGKRSANGIFVNGRQVKSHELNNGDSISFGARIKAAYLSLSMGEVELMDYLESISYHSLKIQVLDSKATLVGDENGIPNEVALAAIGIQEKGNDSIQDDADIPEWVTTLNESELPVLDASDDMAHSPELSARDHEKKSLISLWMAAFGSILGISLLGFGFYALIRVRNEESETFWNPPASAMLSYC